MSARARTPPPSDLVRHAWKQRTEVEYRSAALTQETVLWLLQIGASPDLVRLGLRIVEDEIVHSEMSRQVWLAAGGEGTVHLERGSLSLRRSGDRLEDDVGDAIGRIFCLGETIAVRLFAHLRAGTRVPVARRALDRILGDEVRHRDFGWIALEWLLGAVGDLRERVERKLPTWLGELEKVYGDELPGGIGEVTDDERAWGIAPSAEYSAVLKRVRARDYRRRFARLGISMPA
jgi:hypothetical protein